ncbi:MAG: hypothetical protein IPJ61_19025 [Tessaracoccus sp.]|uniref:hypothetical protein n=1 Tax=Tessaracoccus sp. TaxID=1971211 RepID=UPI001EC04B42|nr:hypothetical protein [Tessaracoccus sp.]MBK7823080.1 hypothetical protein [Tessaracoccus sp.]
MAQAPKTTLPKYNARRGLWVGGDSRTLYTFTDQRTGHAFTKRPGEVHAAGPPDVSVRVATKAEGEAWWGDEAEFKPFSASGWTTLGRLGPSGAYAGKTNFQWLQRDVAGALRRHDCSGARTAVSKALLVARTPRERGAVVAMQRKVLTCEIRGAGVGRARPRQ